MHRFVCGNIKYKTSIIRGQLLILPENIKSEVLEKNQKKIYLNELKENNEELNKIINQKKEIIAEASEKMEEKTLEEHAKNNIPFSEKIKKLTEEESKLGAKNCNLFSKWFKTKDEFKAIEEKIGISKQSHGFSGLILDKNEVMLTFHTSKNNSTIYGIPDENIKIEEELNPIKFVNNPLIISLEDLKKYYKTTNPSKMLESLRYGENNDYDLAYCSYRAIYHSVTQSKNIIRVKFNENEIQVIQKNQIQVNEEKIALNSAELEIEKAFINDDHINIMLKEMSLMKDNDEEKRKIIKMAWDNYESHLS